jgi:hypothetical protein
MPLLAELVAFSLYRCYKDFAPTELVVTSAASGQETNHFSIRACGLG